MSSSDVSSASSATTSTFLTALVFNGAVFAIEVAAFTLLRPYFKQIYEPRSLSPSKDERVKPFKSGMFTWPIHIFTADYRDVQKHNGTDAYFFVRFLRLMVRILLPIWVISWAVLLPITSVRTSVPGNDGLNQFSYGNVATDDSPRYAAHLVLVYIFTFWIFWNIKREMANFVTVRQLHLISEKHGKTVQANTVLVTGIPARFLSEGALLKMYSALPGGVKRVWLNRDLKDLPSIYDRRLSATSKLESAETSLILTAAKLKAKEAKKTEKSGEAVSQQGLVDAERDVTLAEKLVPDNKRPTHRLPVGPMPFSLPCMGQSVDTIEWCREEIRTCNELLQKGRDTIGHENLPMPEDTNGDGRIDAEDRPDQTYPPLNSAFITFNHQLAAHMAAASLNHHDPYRMTDKFLEVSPEDVIWSNLGLNPYERRIRMLISYGVTAGLIILWAFPVAFVGIVSNIKGLCQKAYWLAWLCKIPPEVLGIIQGILPPVLLAVLMMLLPIILRLLAKFEGIPTRTGLELSLMTRFFIFQVIHSFLIVTLSSGIISALPGLLSNPTSIPALLAQHLPGASIFFLTYILLQGLSGVAGGFLAIVQLVLYYVKLFILGSTPRSVYNIKYGRRSVAWGTLFPGITLLVVITLAYSIIAPIINGLSCAMFFMFYLLYKYLFLYQYTQSPESDTGGLFFPKAIQHMFVGLYIQQLCLCALFFLAQNSNKKPAAVPEGALMVVLIAFTAMFHAMINQSYGPLRHFLPLSIADRCYRAPELTDTASLSEKQAAAQAHAENDADGAGPSSLPSSPVIADKEGPTKGTAAGSSQEAITRPSADSTGSRRAFVDPHTGAVDYGFAHPAISRPQRIVWFPQDRLGLAAEEVQANAAAEVGASTDGAVVNEKGHVEISAPPPDEGRV